MTQIFVPIDSSDLKEQIPDGEDIIYSSLFEGHNVAYGKTYFWSSHVLITKNYVAFQEPDYLNSKNPMKNHCIPWGRINYIKKLRGKAGFGITWSFNLTLIKSKEEPKAIFKERSNDFIATFRPYLIEKKKEYILELQNNPEVSNKVIKKHQNLVINLIKMEQKRLKKLK